MMQQHIERYPRTPGGQARRRWHRGAFALTAAAALTACGGGGGADETVLPAGGGASPSQPAALCPESLDYGTTFTGGTGSGELVTLQMDTTQNSWTVTILDSSVPREPGTVSPSRADPTDGRNVLRGTLVRETQLPTAQQNKCAFRLEGPGIDPARPVRMFVGQGVAGGAIPGARIQFDGFLSAGAVPETLFPFFQFLGFTDIERDLSKVAGQYHGVGFHVVPTQSFQRVAQDFRMNLNADGSFEVCDNATSTCDAHKGDKFVPHASGALLSTNYKGEVQPPSIGETRGRAYLIVGKLRGQLVPVMIRAGYTNDPTGPAGGNAAADDELGIGVMAPVANIPRGSIDGQYIGVDSNFDYRATALVDQDAAVLDPFRAHDASLAVARKLDYAQKEPGVITTRRKEAAADAPPTGKLIHSGGIYGFIENRDSADPLFGVGALVQ